LTITTFFNDSQMVWWMNQSL